MPSIETRRASAGEARDLKHGLLTYTLLAAVEAADGQPLNGRKVKTGSDGVDVLDWFRFVRGEVPGLSKDFTGRTQQVELSGEDQPGYILLRLR